MEISIDGVKVLLNKRRVCIYAKFSIGSVCRTLTNLYNLVAKIVKICSLEFYFNLVGRPRVADIQNTLDRWPFKF